MNDSTIKFLTRRLWFESGVKSNVTADFCLLIYYYFDYLK